MDLKKLLQDLKDCPCGQEHTFDTRCVEIEAGLTARAGAILRGEPLVASGAEGINGLTLSNAMHLSAFTGKQVSLPLDDDFYYEELMKRVATSRRKEGGKTVFADTSKTYSGSK